MLEQDDRCKGCDGSDDPGQKHHSGVVFIDDAIVNRKHFVSRHLIVLSVAGRAFGRSALFFDPAFSITVLNNRLSCISIMKYQLDGVGL